MGVTLLNGRRAENLAELIQSLGVAPKRIRLHPPPGRATIDDLIRINESQDRIYELVEGTLVEKIMGIAESWVASRLIMILGAFVMPRKLGYVLGADAAMRIMPHLVRAPDVCFIRREKCPDGKVPREPVPELVPDLAVEVLSKSNRSAEMKRKRREYFASGVSLVWYIDPDTETADVFTRPEGPNHVVRNGTLDGGAVLPGFSLRLADLFTDLEPPKKKRRKH